MLIRLRRTLLCAAVALGLLGASPALAMDPMLMFLFGMAREIMYEAFQNSRKPPAPNSEPLPAVYPGTMVEPRKLRELIDESFFYLSERRRDELFEALHDEIIKPKNAAVRASMIAYFAEHAVAVRQVMDRLSKLNETEMRELSVRFAAQARALPVEEREQLRKALDEGLLPVPPDLNQRLVVAVAEIPRPPPSAAEAVPTTAEDDKPGGTAPTQAGKAPPAIAATTSREPPAPSAQSKADPPAPPVAAPAASAAPGKADTRKTAPAVW